MNWWYSSSHSSSSLEEGKVDVLLPVVGPAEIPEADEERDHVQNDQRPEEDGQQFVLVRKRTGHRDQRAAKDRERGHRQRERAGELLLSLELVVVAVLGELEVHSSGSMIMGVLDRSRRRVAQQAPWLSADANTVGSICIAREDPAR